MKIITPILYADARAVQGKKFPSSSVGERPGEYNASLVADNPQWHEFFRQEVGRHLEAQSQPYLNGACPPLGLSNGPFSDKDFQLLPWLLRRQAVRAMHGSHGQSGMLPRSQKKLKRVLCAVQEVYGKERLALFTGTLSEQIAKAVQGDNLSVLTENFKRIVTRAQVAAGLEPVFAGCIEVQPKRLSRTGTVAYHWHIVVLARHGGGAWAFTTHEWNAMWNHAIALTVGEGKGFSQPGWIDVQPIKYDAARYLAKYVSKGESAVSEVLANDPGHVFPRRWWTATNFARHIEKSMQIEIDPDKFQSFIEAVERDLPGQVVFQREVEIPLMTWVGGSGFDDDEEWECNLLNVGRIVQFRDYFTVASYAINNDYVYIRDKIHDVGASLSSLSAV